MRRNNLLPILLLLIISAKVFSQGSNSAQFGTIRPLLHKDSPYKNSFWPGFSINAYGFSLSVFAGRNAVITPADPINGADYKVAGSFFDFGYKHEFKGLSPFKKFIKRPFIFPTLGGGLGGYGINGRMGFQINLRPGIKFSLMPGVSIYAEAYTGVNFISDKEEEVKEKSVKGFYFTPAFGIQFDTDLTRLISDVWVKKDYSSGGWKEHEYTGSDGNRYVEHYYQPAGNYVTSYVTHSRNILNLYGKGLVGSGQNEKGTTLAGGAGLALRYGMFAFDLEYLVGKVGYSYGDDPDERMQNSWNMNRFGFGMGIDLFGLPRPFKKPSFIRLIIGAKVGTQTLVSDLNKYSQTVAAIPNGDFKAQDIHGQMYWSSGMSLEFGTLGFSFETFNSKDGPYKSGFVIGAKYMLPLIMAKNDD